MKRKIYLVVLFSIVSVHGMEEEGMVMLLLVAPFTGKLEITNKSK
jgi:hypothetical protein